MAIREIVFHPNDTLRRKAAPIEQFDPALRALSKDMLETMQLAEGVGLAGPQIGVAQRIFVMRVRENDQRAEGDPLAGKPLVLINPEIVEESLEMVEGMEGCLSIPGYAGLVDRHQKIVVLARNEWGKPKRYVVEGYLARVMQHEIDHLDGILFLDRLKGDDKLFKVVEHEEEAASE
ncbi:MAG: peptide deformylase [Ardenticatenales bacterium]|nr:peptide deformylase [Ardenticatenales bacterium]